MGEWTMKYLEILIFVSLVFSVAAQNCTSDADCPDNHVICEDSECACATGFMSTSYNDTCSKILGSLCFTDIDCEMDNVTCNQSMCTCTSGYEEQDAMCTEVYLRSCNSDSECTLDHMSCVSAQCTCNEGFQYSNNMCLRVVGSACAIQSDCPMDHVICTETQNCTCDIGYVEENDICVEVYLHTCASDSECPLDQMSCVNAQCTCDEGFQYGNVSCSHVLGSFCYSESDCLMSNVMCNVTSSECTCAIGYVEHNDMCNEEIYLRSCNTDSECPLEHMSCVSAQCMCNEGFQYSNDLCSRVLGSACTSVSYCPIDNVICEDSQCTCDGGYMEDNSICVEVYLHTCTGDGECPVDQMSCVNAQCMCDEGFQYGDVSCSRVLGSFCYSQSDCLMSNVMCNVTSSECTCATGYLEYNYTCIDGPGPITLVGVSVVTTEEITDTEHTAALKCLFNIDSGYKYKVKWYVSGILLLGSGVVDEYGVVSAAVIKDYEWSRIGLDSIPFNIELHCSVTLYAVDGITELMHFESGVYSPLQISAVDISLLRAHTASFTVTLNIPFGCPSSAQECNLKYELYDPSDNYRCWYSSIAILHSDTCGGRVEGSTQLSTEHVTSAHYVTNITLTTKTNNLYYYRKKFYSMELRSYATGNTKQIWNSVQSSMAVSVTDHQLGYYYYYNYYYWSLCYVTGDPYMYTFDRRSYSNQNVGEFVLVRHKRYPIEVQMITKPCFSSSWWWTPPRTCACALTVKAGGDIFTLNHCYGHLTHYLSAKDGALKVYQVWSNSYDIYLPTGMVIYVYVMPYRSYTMNIAIYPSANDIGNIEGLCGNYNGERDDDIVHRYTGQVYTSRKRRSHFWRAFNPDEFSFSWELQNKQDESLLNPDVYNNAESWNSDEKLCVCPYMNENNHVSVCAIHEDDTCTQAPWYTAWGTLVSPSTRQRRMVNSHQPRVDKALMNKILANMVKLSKDAQKKLSLFHRNKRQSEVPTNITFDEAWVICEQEFNACPGAAAKDVVDTDFNTTLGNCAQDVMVDGTTEWFGSHCDAQTQQVLVQIEKDENITQNNPEIVQFVRENSCPGNCSDNGACVNGSCECYPDFGTDLCTIKLTTPPSLQLVGDNGICDVGTGSTCPAIIIVSDDGFVEGLTGVVDVFEAGTNGSFIEVDSFETPCEYISFNEALVPTSISETTRRKRDADNTTSAPIARMLNVSVSNDGVNFGQGYMVVILDTTCQTTSQDASGDTIAILKTGYCYIDAVCVTEGTAMVGETCLTCKSSTDPFYWTNTCGTTSSTPEVEGFAFLVVVIVCPIVAVIIIIILVIVIKKYLYSSSKTVLVCPVGGEQTPPEHAKLTGYIRTGLGPAPYGYGKKRPSFGVVSHGADNFEEKRRWKY